MNAPLSPAPDLPALVVSASLAEGVSPEGVSVMSLDQWQAALIPLGGATGPQGLALGDMTVLGLCLTEDDADRVVADAGLSALLDAAGIPLRRLPPQAGPAEITAAAWAMLIDRHRATVRQGASDRSALAELRKAHMQMQTDHAELESWVWDALAPKHKQVRAWPVTAQTLTLAPGDAPVRQALPVPARGFAAVDVHLAESAPEGTTLRLQLVRPVGPDFDDAATEVAVPVNHVGWLRLTLPRAPGGAPEDAEIALEVTGPAPLRLSLAPESPFADLRARAGASALPQPLSLRIFQTLPRMPAPALHDTRYPLPADGRTRLIRPSDMSAPEQLPYWGRRVRRGLRAYPDFTRVEHWAEEDVHFVHPSAHRPVVARVPGLTAEALVQIRGIVQIGRHDTMEVAFAIGAAPAGTVTSVQQAQAHLGQWVHLLPAEWGDVWYEPPEPLEGKVDLLLATAMPNMPFNRNADALFHGYRLTSRADAPA